MTNAHTIASAAQSAESTLQDRASRLVDREVIVCLSSMVSTLAGAYGGEGCGRDLSDLAEQAFELACPIPDYEEAATQEGFKVQEDGTWVNSQSSEENYDSAQDACEAHNVEPYDREVYEHWAVSTWLAEKLTEAGERVDTDFANLNVWARTTTGQAISMDGVIRRIVRDLHASA